MKRISLFLVSLSIVISFAISATANERPLENISVALVLNSTPQKDKTGSVSATLIIRNTGKDEIKVQHPHNRMVVSFIVMNSLGNVVPPVGLAKVDPAFQEITIRPDTEYKQSFPKLEFLTGSALFGYKLEPGETYRVVAIYRPNGKNGSGIASAEQIIEIK